MRSRWFIEAPCPAAGPTVVLGDPQSPAFVGCDGNRILNIGFGREELELKSGWKLGRLDHLGRIHWAAGRFLRVDQGWEIIGDRAR